MRLVLAIFIAWAGCSDSENDRAQPQGEPSSKPPGSELVDKKKAAATRDSTATKPTPAPSPAKPTKKVIRTFRGHLREGRKLKTELDSIMASTLMKIL